MNRFVAVVILSLLCAKNGESVPVTGDGTGKVAGETVYAPYPEYPVVARMHRWIGKGYFRCRLHPNGGVLSVQVLRSTGYDILDQAAIAALRQWRFKVIGLKGVIIPVTFSLRVQ
jgi:protein TonB